MDAVEFIKEEIRMCASYEGCTECPLYNTVYCSASPKKRTQEEAEEIVRRVKEWSVAHPRKTRQSVFLKQYPEAALDKNGYPVLKPCGFYKKMREECIGKLCHDCRREFWMQEVE